MFEIDIIPAHVERLVESHSRADEDRDQRADVRRALAEQPVIASVD